jgi:putative Ca2+/H+ antiporter (TMEM165/GDT1 family)
MPTWPPAAVWQLVGADVAVSSSPPQAAGATSTAAATRAMRSAGVGTEATVPVADVAAAFAIVFLAELGDKTQLVALTLAGRYPATRVLLALGTAIAVLQTLSVTVGAVVSRTVPDTAVAVGAGLLFCGFAAWTWRSAEGVEDGADDGATASAGLVGVAFAFFLAELGDKTMLTTAGLAADRSALPVWVGSLAAMLAATTLAVVAGRALTTRVDPSVLRRIGAVAFAVVGVATLVGAAA